MKVKLDTVVVDLMNSNAPIIEDEKPLTIGKVMGRALFAQFPAENPPPDGEEKFRRGMLGILVTGDEAEVNLTAEDIVRIKACIEKAYNPHILVQVYRALDRGDDQ